MLTKELIDRAIEIVADEGARLPSRYPGALNNPELQRVMQESASKAREGSKTMQITLNVEGSQLDAEVREIIKSLTPEQKAELARDVLTKNLENVNSELNAKAARDAAIAEWDAKNEERRARWHDGRWQTWHRNYQRWEDAYWNASDELQKLTAKHSYTYEYYRKEILTEMAQAARQQIASAVESSEVIQNAIAKVTKEIEESFPKIVHDAIVLHFCTNLQNLAKSVAQSMFQIQDQNKLLQDIQSKL